MQGLCLADLDCCWGWVGLGWGFTCLLLGLGLGWTDGWELGGGMAERVWLRHKDVPDVCLYGPYEVEAYLNQVCWCPLSHVCLVKNLCLNCYWAEAGPALLACC